MWPVSIISSSGLNTPSVVAGGVFSSLPNSTILDEALDVFSH